MGIAALALLVGIATVAFTQGWFGGRDTAPDPGGDALPAGPDPDAPVPQVDAAPVAGQWRELPAAALEPRTEQVAVWAQDRLLVWGGALDDGLGRTVFRADGAGLDAGGTWTPLPEAPLAPRTGHVAAWTGSELLVWGGKGSAGYFADGATYDPATGSWAPLPEAPLSPRAGVAVVWSGDQLLLFGGSDNSGPLTDAAAFDPASRSWTPLPGLPEELERATELRAVWAGDTAVVWSPGRGGLAFPDLARFDPAAGAWTALPDPGDGEYGVPLVAWTGQELLALGAAYDGTGARLLALPPGGETWQERGTPPALDDPWEATAVWTGTQLVVALGDAGPDAVRYDPASDRWARIPEAPLETAATALAAWTGEELLVLAGPPVGATPAPPRAAAWRFSP